MKTGDEQHKADLEDKLAAFDPNIYWEIHPHLPATIAFTTMARETSTSIPAKDPYNYYEGRPSYARQLSEPVPTFLSRLPPLTTTTEPWIKIGNPYTTYRHTNEDLQGLKLGGTELLEDFDAQKADIENSMSGKAKGTITRKITPLREKLKVDLLKTAKEKACTTGKWMLFPGPDHVNSVWSLIATATANDELGIAAKVATAMGNDPDKARLICVYTENFDDKDDVKRVVERLYAMGLCSRNGATGEARVIYYKADVYTHLEIEGGNPWGLRPSFYSSREILGEGK